MNKHELDLKKFVRWGDSQAGQRLIDQGILIPLPKEFIHAMHTPDECFKCAWRSGGLLGCYYFLKNKLRSMLLER